VVLLRLECERVGAWKRLTWDADPRSGEGMCCRPGSRRGGELIERIEYPHLRGQLEGENVESFREVHRRKGREVRTEKDEGWEKALEQVKGWLV